MVSKAHGSLPPRTSDKARPSDSKSLSLVRVFTFSPVARNAVTVDASNRFVIF